MIIWMIIYHALFFATKIQLLEYADATDVAQLPSGIQMYTNGEGRIVPLNPCVYFPYLHFFMPWFFYKSGQFFVKRTTAEMIRKDARKLLLPFLTWSLVGFAMYLLFRMLTHTITWQNSTLHIVSSLFVYGCIPLNLPMWFLFTLCIVKWSANLCLQNPTTDSYYKRVIVVVFVCYVATVCAHLWHHKYMPEWIINGASGLAFFTLGYGLKKYENRMWLFIPCLIVYTVCCFVGFPMVDMHTNSLLYGYYWLWMPVAAVCIIAFNNMCAILCKHFTPKFIPWVGRNAMYIFATHFLILCTIEFIVTYFEIVALYKYALWLMLVAYVLLLPILCKVLHLIIDE